MQSLHFTLVIGLVCLAGCSTLPPAQRTTTSDASHSYVSSGIGSPTIVLESGLGDGKEAWEPVYDQIAQVSTVFAYDRAGYGSSKSTNRSRDGATIVAELRATLRSIGLDPPFILVGHSIGGTYMELYARTYPDDVAGVVLIDSRHADFDRQCQVAGARMCKPPAILSALLPQTPRRELAAGEHTMQAVMTAGSFPDVPLSVLSSPNKSLEGKRFRDVWLATQESLATLSSKSEHVVCSRCGHYIHRDDPALVISAINDIVQLVRSERAEE